MSEACAISVGNRTVGIGQPCYIVAEMSGNHNQDLDRAVALVEAAAEAGADAIKLQTYTPDTLTIDCDNEYFMVGAGTMWQGKNLYQLYSEAHTPWEWHPRLKQVAEENGLDFFSTAFDATAVDFLEELGVPVHKVASFEAVDLPLLRKIGATQKPVIMSTGMATLAEIDEAVTTLRNSGSDELALLKCTSAYPATPSEMNIRTMSHLGSAFSVPVGLSDHTLGIAVSVAAVALGASIIEKHLTLSRKELGPDSGFSMEPQELKAMVESIRAAEQAVGAVSYELTDHERGSRVFRRSLMVVKDMKAGDSFTRETVRCIRPGYGLHSRHLDDVLGRVAHADIPRGTPLAWDMLGAVRG